MPTFTQGDRPLRITTNLGQDVLLLQGMTGQEGVSIPFTFSLDLRSEQAAIDPLSMLKSRVCITIDMAERGQKRLIHGQVNRFTQLEREKELVTYRAQIVPWLWFLSLSSECKIFQNKTALEIVEAVFRAQGFSDFEIRCRRSDYPKREFCVQYRETHLNFVSRLLEEEGVYYFFEHSTDKHTLVLADGPMPNCPGQSTARLADQSGEWQTEDVVLSLQPEHTVPSGKVTLRDYTYLQPSLELERAVSGSGTGEVYEYPGGYVDMAGERNPTELLNRYARLMLEEQEASQHLVRGESTCRGFLSGHTFELRGHYRSDVNQKYQLLQVQHSARNSDYQSGEGGGFIYQNSFVGIPHSTSFRPPRRAPKPAIQGSQTAVVVGKSGEEIWVDAHGRVKVQFFWDRVGGKDENSSCWVRVASVWAGKNWGFIQVPRIGQEVIIDFVDGDPDRPIITGRLYNADQTPPYALPANQTQSGVKTRSSKQGGTDNFNEIRIEDKKGSEELFFHAEKDLRTEVENDETRTIGHDRVTTIENADTRTVNQGDDTETIKQGNQTVTIEMGNQEVTLKQGNQTIVLSMGNQETKVNQGNVTTKAALGNIAFEAMQAIELKVGQNSIKIEQAGVTIKGLNVKVEGQVQAEIKSVMTTVKGDGMLTVKGGITMIN